MAICMYKDKSFIFNLLLVAKSCGKSSECAQLKDSVTYPHGKSSGVTVSQCCSLDDLPKRDARYANTGSKLH